MAWLSAWPDPSQAGGNTTVNYFRRYLALASASWLVLGSPALGGTPNRQMLRPSNPCMLVIVADDEHSDSLINKIPHLKENMDLASVQPSDHNPERLDMTAYPVHADKNSISGTEKSSPGQHLTWNICNQQLCPAGWGDRTLKVVIRSIGSCWRRKSTISQKSAGQLRYVSH